MPASHLVLGLDGADLDLIERLGPETLPALHGLMTRGAYAHLESVQPPATLPNWTTFLTGTNPGVHGVFDFTTRRGSSVRFTAGTVRAVPTVAARLDRLGQPCAVVGFPATWPPEPLKHGIFISGWDSPVAFEADRSFVHPPWLFDAIRAQFGTPRFDDVDEFDATETGWHQTLPGALETRIARKLDLARWLLRQRHWGLFAFYFGESDTAAHHLWSLADPDSPRCPQSHEGIRGKTRSTGLRLASSQNPLRRVYRALDGAVAALIADVPDAEITVVSDHGSGGASDKVLYLNRALESAGMLRFRRPAGSQLGRIATWGKDRALTSLPPKARQRLFRVGGAVLPGLVESRARFGAIDFSQTAAFSDELNYFPAIHLNLKGREPKGVIGANDIDAIVRQIDEAMRSLRDPWTGSAVVQAVHRREELFQGPCVSRAPDLLLELHLDGNYSYNLQPSATAPPGTGPWRRLEESEYLGRKGRSLPGSHRPHGLLVLAGPRIAPVGRIEARIADATATMLARMDVQIPAEWSGRVLWETLVETNPKAAELPYAPPPRSGGKHGEAIVERRLRALGYVD